MADIVCPKCGKPNPAGSTTCRYCKTPLTAAVNNPPASTAPAGNSDDTPDWLNSLRGDTASASSWNEPAAEENASANGISEGEVPDWLHRIRERNQEGDEAGQSTGPENAGQSFSDNKDELPDWLNQTTSNASSSSTSLEDWLMKLREDEPAPENKPAAPSQPAIKPALTQPKTPVPPADDETSEWLKGLQSWKPNSPLFDNDLSEGQAGQIPAKSSSLDQKTIPVQSAAPENVDTPDWLKGFSTPESDSQQPVQPSGQEMPDLLSRISEPPSVAPIDLGSIIGRPGITDWLRHMPAQPNAAPPADNTSNQPAEASDWLSDLRAQPDQAASTGSEPSKNAVPDQSEQEPAALPAEETPDWLKNLSAGRSETAAAAQPVQAAPAEEIPDWLKSLSPGSAEPTTAAQPVQQPSAAPSGDTPDWLKSFAPNPAEASAPSQTESAAPAAPADETPDWLKSFSPTSAEAPTPVQPVQETPAAPADEAPDWLASFASSTAEASTPVQPVQETPAPPADEASDWLKSFAPTPAESSTPVQPDQPAPAAPSAPSDETPDWLASFASGTAETSTPAQPVQPAPPAPAGEASDWLKSFASSSAEASAPAVPADETPDWLKNLTPGPADASAALQPAQQVPVQPAEPIQPPSQALESTEPAQVPPAAGGDMPDWLQNISGRPAAVEASPVTAPGLTANENTPDWLQSFASAGSTAQPADTASMAAQPTRAPAAAENAGQVDPDWLNRITKVIQPTDQAGAPPVAPAIETGGAVLGEIPDWLSSIKPEETSHHEDTTRPAFVLDNSSIELPASEEPGKNPFAGEGVPDWLSEVPQGAEAQSGQAGQADGSTEHLEPAQLPGWLQAMRPLEAVAPTAVPVDDQRVEKSGPLAGLKGVLPSDDTVTQYRKPPSYSVKLKVTEKQRASATLLEQMLGEESAPQAIPQDHFRIPQRLVRLVVAILLIAVLLFPLLTNGPIVVPPVITPPTNVVQFHTALDALPDGGHVLLAVDYDPGFAGEMNFAAAGVLQRLIEKNESLIMVSTVPAGPVMAQNLVAQALQNRPDLAAKYSLSNSVINLGYLPGGAASLQEFASAPRQAAQYGFKAGVDASSPWLQPALQNIQDVSQFSMVMVLTDSLDSGRAWIEQVQPALKTTPLMMVVSAQTAPLIQPYVYSGQVKAMISGLAGGAAFQEYLKTTVTSAADWNAYTSGLLVLVALILLGIILQVGTFLFSHRKGGG
ncbi:MAG: hypothetical protein P4L50_16750 [Anaerolineaceae bacterium]|nr:hypothetical protein [Anaerolineaceae bacterium]